MHILGLLFNYKNNSSSNNSDSNFELKRYTHHYIRRIQCFNYSASSWFVCIGTNGESELLLGKGAV